MQNDYEKLLNRLPAPEPHSGLFGAIMHRISAERVRVAKRRFVIFAVGCIGSLLAIIPTFITMRASMVQSGFAEFFSLLFSDAGLMTTYWQNFALTLLESLPAVSIAAFLVTVFVFLGSLRFLTRDIKIVFSY